MDFLLRCRDPETACMDLAGLFEVDPAHLAGVLSPAAEIAIWDDTDPIRALVPAVSDRLGTSITTPATIHYFHGSRARNPQAFMAAGLYPLSAVLDDLWGELAELLPEVPASEIDRLREDLTQVLIGPHTYRPRANDRFDDGPFAHLVRDPLLHPDAYHSVDYLAGAEIAIDICQAMGDRFGVDVTARYRRATSPCIVEFALPPSDDVEGTVAAALWYVEAALRGERTSNANWGFDGHGAPVPAEAIVSVSTTPVE